MTYKVQAKFIGQRLGDFFEKLTDGTIRTQRPDGEEIVASMKRAKITSTGIVEWYETCFCPTPLLHERKTQYDRYFSEIMAEPVEDYGEVEGKPFWSYMESVKTGKGST